MLLTGQGTYTLSACFQFCRVFLSHYNVKFTGSSMNGIKVFVVPGGIILSNLNSETRGLIVDLPEPELFIKRKHNVHSRFIHVLDLLVEVYKIPQTSLHTFADEEGQLISFNRGGSLFLSLRYSETWHTSCVSALL
jgi:hypothetical protein